MKRIIDISEQLYETCIRLNNEGDARPSAVCIANSLPYEERPQDNWIYNDGSYKCSKCGHEIISRPQDLNYCCKCGAVMRFETDITNESEEK